MGCDFRAEARHADPRPVLVVEDSDDDFDSVIEAAALARVGNRLVRAVNVDIARDLLAQAPAAHFAFMLLDYNLPGLDGLALLGHIRRSPLLAGLPAVIYTTGVNPRDLTACYKAGASEVRFKSVQYTECLLTLQAIFDHWLNRAALPNQLAHVVHAKELA